MAPVETANGAPLMHSKVFYARSGKECWLWTGSHNLTGNATQGANCEAAILLHGSSDEKPFRDALEHLETCRSWATLYDPDAPPPGSAQRADILVIHAESDPVLAGTLPWHVHLCLDSPDFDRFLRTATDVRLILYPRGSLANGWQGATPFGAYSGALTGLNFTARNRNSKGGGTVAQWNAATLSICEVGGVLSLEPARPLGPKVTTQAVMFFDAPVALDELLFAEEPKVKKELLTGPRSLMPVDSDMVQYYSKKDVLGLNLKVIPYVGKKQIIQVGEKDVRPSDLDRIRMNFGTENDFDIEMSSLSVAREMKRHSFIVRVKFRLAEKKADEGWLLD